MRNVFKQAKIGRESISNRRDLTIDELYQIIDKFNERTHKESITSGLWEAISTAFYMGYAVGTRASKA